MAIDDKTLQATEMGQPTFALPYCPECGRPWREIPTERPSASVSLRAALLIVVGLALAIAFGERAAAAYRTQVAAQSDAAALTMCLDGMRSDPGCPSVQDGEDWRAVDYSIVTTARRLLGRALVGAAVASLAFAVGLGSVAARRSRVLVGPSGWSRLAAVWRIGETLLAVICLLVLALYLDLITLQLSSGGGLTRDVLDRAADDALVVVFLVIGG